MEKEDGQSRLVEVVNDYFESHIKTGRHAAIKAKLVRLDVLEHAFGSVLPCSSTCSDCLRQNWFQKVCSGFLLIFLFFQSESCRISSEVAVVHAWDHAARNHNRLRPTSFSIK